MAKREISTSSKRLPMLVIVIALAAGGWWIWHSPEISNWKDRVLQYVDNRDIETLEARYLPNEIFEAHQNELIGSDKKNLHNTALKYYPYLLLDVKYRDHAKTREGVLLWGMTEGEIILNTDTWEATHGFRDCLECQASKNDFKVMNALASHQGVSSIEQLQKDLRLERDVLDILIENAREKGLVIQNGSQVQLHFENPKILVTPQTKINQHFVYKPMNDGQKVPRAYSQSQIMTIAQEAFGNDFKIRSSKEVFLPVYSLEILNPDGSVQTSEWNALTGEKIVPHYLST